MLINFRKFASEKLEAETGSRFLPNLELDPFGGEEMEVDRQFNPPTTA